MQPLISVIVPLFNGERYLAETLNSVLAQTYGPLQVIVVDDGSTDGSADVVAGYGGSVTYVRQVNKGTSAARNRGVTLARAEYLAFLDQDDLWCADKLAGQMKELQEDPSLAMVFGHVQQFRSPDWHEPSGYTLYLPEAPVPGYLPSAMLIRRESFTRVGPFSTAWRLAQWADWYLRAIDAGLTSRMMPHLVAWRRLHEHNQGLTSRGLSHEYACVIKQALDRRRRRDHAPMPIPARLNRYSG